MMIGEQIKQQRMAMELTQEELAEKLNVTPQAVSRWETEVSYPDIALIPRLSEVLHMSCDDLLLERQERHYGYVGPLADAKDPLSQKEIDELFGFCPDAEKADYRRVLHVDDSDYLRMMVKNILSSQGYEVLEAKDGRECMSILAREQVDILLLDINMPVMHGFEVLVRVKEEYPELPVVMLSAANGKEGVHKSLELGAAGFVAKPFGADALLEHLRSVTKRGEHD